MTQESLELEVPTQEQEEVSEGPFMIETIDQFAELMTGWHQNGVASAMHLLEVPEGMEVKIEEEESFFLDGDAHRAFKMGVQLTLNFLGTLPFKAAEPSNDQPAD